MMRKINLDNIHMMRKIKLDNIHMMRKIKLFSKSKFKIFVKKEYIIVHLNDKIFLKQEYIKNKSKQFTFFYVLHILHKYGMEVT